jgi:CRISPR-associated protein Cas1
MKTHLNTLFVTTQGAYVARERENLLVRADDEIKLRVPVHLLAGLVCFGRVGLSSASLALCGERGIPVSLLSRGGRFRARLVGPTTGNVLLRRAQYRAADAPSETAAIAKDLVTAKILNARTVLVRAGREDPPACAREPLDKAASRLAELVRLAAACGDVDRVRGYEGEAARTYFGVFDQLLRNADAALRFNGRSRRPPRDAVNALLSFVYVLLLHDVRSAAEVAGLDPAVGFLHRDRPGRPGLALDLMEEMRPFFADRLVLTLVNRRMLKAQGFVSSESGAVLMDEATREVVLRAYQKRKRDTIRHPFLDEETTVGHLWYLQALLFARFLRGELDAYPPFLWR